MPFGPFVLEIRRGSDGFARCAGPSSISSLDSRYLISDWCGGWQPGRVETLHGACPVIVFVVTASHGWPFGKDPRGAPGCVYGSNYILPSCAVVMMKAAFDSEDIQVQDNHDDDDETLPPTPRSLASKPRARMTGRAFPPQAPFSSRSNHQTSKRPRLRFLPLIQLGAAQVRALGKGKGERPPTHCQLSPSGARLLASKETLWPLLLLLLLLLPPPSTITTHPAAALAGPVYKSPPLALSLSHAPSRGQLQLPSSPPPAPSPCARSVSRRRRPLPIGAHTGLVSGNSGDVPY
ncbi:hypothetical protein M430DRAFT_17863 [Amorphotheca resinae ATCC 22711]|uniref:Uncharacterized protein n=1 Tax=Amorphotheca resinae ATCC 22711 TaxID=857342 RepID=A0A2T3B6C3_AMORE|nr:hypothetical protein M430DRAFT_17863 [Amorphotheca resinae ATCC 22711]PSS22304.1 hypothetical protein M430DRAFT_17863 [Amorphotheca resinae ATCC 22711]